MQQIETLKRYITQYSMNLVPLEPRQKWTDREGWGTKTLSTTQQVEDFYTKHKDWNVGVELGSSRICSLDIDCLESFKIVCSEYGIDISTLNKHPTIQGSAKGLRVIFREPEEGLPYFKLNWPRQDDPSKHYTIFELRAGNGKHRMDVLPPSVHPEGPTYKWLVEPGETIPEPPEWLLNLWRLSSTIKPQLKSMCPWAAPAPQPSFKSPPVHSDLTDCVFTAWNNAHNIHNTLEKYGYRRVSTSRYVSPHSTTGLAGVHVWEDSNKCYIHHASDPLCSEDDGKPVGPFDLFCQYEHQGNIANAAMQARQVLGMPSKVISLDSDIDVSALLASADKKQEEDKPPQWLISGDDFLKDYKPISWIIKGILPASSAIMLFGPSGGGKSFLILDWMLHIASGMDRWNGHRVKPGAVVYLAGEGHHGVKTRIKAWLQSREKSISNLDFHISRSSCDFNTPLGLQLVSEQLAAIDCNPKLIVIDTVNRFLDGDENNSQDVRGMMNNVEAIKALYPGCSVCLVHHTGVSGEAQGRARGSSAWKASMEIELCVTPKGDGLIELSHKKAKDGKEMDAFHFELKEIELEGLLDEDGDPVTSAIVSPAKANDTPPTDSKLHVFMSWFRDAWMISGGEFLGDKNALCAYISRAALRAFFVDNLEMAGRTADNHLRPSEGEKMIGYLLSRGIIERYNHGYMVLCAVHNSKLSLLKNENAL